MKSSVLAVGTELISGQITNRNAAWISQKLSEMGLQTEIHLTVADDRAAILEALHFLESKSDLIFVSGGLGPTSDDFTRELITEWAQQSPVFHEESWKKIQEKLNSRGLPIADNQKQQCYFPDTSQVLDNSQGTANAFYLKKNSKHLWARPGPPNEVAAVWNDHIQTQLQSMTQNLDRYVTVSWDALGLGEAIAPSLVEPAAVGSGADIGYRVHMPYLEIKFSYYKSQHEKMLPHIARIEESLKKYTISRNGQDILDPLSRILEKVPLLHVCDQVSKGLLFSRLLTIRKNDMTFTTQKSLKPDPLSWQIYCHFINEFEFELELSRPDQAPIKKIIGSPFNRGPQMSDRRRQYFSEMTLITAVQEWNFS